MPTINFLLTVSLAILNLFRESKCTPSDDLLNKMEDKLDNGITASNRRLWRKSMEILLNSTKNEAILFHGPSGSGKGFVMQEVSASYQEALRYKPLQVSFIDLCQMRNGDKLHSFFKLQLNKIELLNSSFLFRFKHLDKFCALLEAANDPKVIGLLKTEIEDLKAQPKKIIIIATTVSLVVLPEAIQNLFDHIVEFSFPTAEDRRSLLCEFSKAFVIDHVLDFEAVAKDPRCEGLNADQLLGLIDTAEDIAMGDDHDILGASSCGQSSEWFINQSHMDKAFDKIKLVTGIENNLNNKSLINSSFFI